MGRVRDNAGGLNVKCKFVYILLYVQEAGPLHEGALQPGLYCLGEL